MTILEVLLFVYLAGFVVKAILMLATVHVAAGAHQRLFARNGIRLPYFGLYAVLTVYVILTAFLLWTRALRHEGLGFFGAYTRREVLRDCVSSFR